MYEKENDNTKTDTVQQISTECCKLMKHNLVKNEDSEHIEAYY